MYTICQVGIPAIETNTCFILKFFHLEKTLSHILCTNDYFNSIHFSYVVIIYKLKWTLTHKERHFIIRRLFKL